MLFLRSAKNLINEFEKKHKLLKLDVYDTEDNNNNKENNKNDKKIEKIIQLFEIDGVAKFLIQYKDNATYQNEFIETKKLNQTHPQLVIKFYESRIYIEKRDKKIKKIF